MSFFPFHSSTSTPDCEMFLNQTNGTRHRKKHESTRKRSRYTHSDGRGKRLWKHITKMQKCFYSAVGVQASCLGPGRPLFVSQILKEQDAFCAPQKNLPTDRGLWRPPTERGTALWSQLKTLLYGGKWKREKKVMESRGSLGHCCWFTVVSLRAFFDVLKCRLVCCAFFQRRLRWSLNTVTLQITAAPY